MGVNGEGEGGQEPLPESVVHCTLLVIKVEKAKKMQ